MANQADSHRLKMRNLDVEKLLEAIGSPRYYLCISKGTIMGVKDGPPNCSMIAGIQCLCSMKMGVLHAGSASLQA